MRASTHPGLRLALLGQWGLVSTDASELLLPPGKPLAALSYLACAERRAVSRSTLVGLLWADQEPDAARHSFRQTLWYLKRKAGEQLIVAEGDTLRLSDTVSVDRDDLLSASRAGDHERVVELYTGEFIPSFAAPGGSGFEEWAALERRRLLEIFRHSAERVIADRVGSGRARDAIALGKRLRDQDIYNEGGWRLLIELCLSAGDLLSARAEAEALVQLAERDATELEPSTRAAIRATRVTNGASPAPVDDSIQPSLVGREDSFATLLAAWESARAGQLTRLHITSRAGLGKTRLLRDLAARLRALRGKVVFIGGSLGTRELDFALAGELAAGLTALPGKSALSPQSAATLVDLNPTLSTFFDRPGRAPEPSDVVRTRALALRELLQVVSFESTVAVLIDDMHWWDEASTATLAAALEGLAGARILLVTAGRPEARSHSFVSGHVTTHLELSPLSVAHVEELLLTVASLPAQPWAADFPAEVWRASRGSPLLALELLQHLEEQRLLQRVHGVWGTNDSGALTNELRQGDVMRSRIGGLDRGDFWILTLLATAGITIDQPTLIVASGRPVDDVTTRLQSLEARGLVVHEGAGWRHAHDEIADEAIRAAPPEVALKAAAQLGDALGTQGIVDAARARRAMHLLRAGDNREARVDVFRRFAAYRYSLGDRRPIHGIARDVLGPSASSREVDDLVRSAPLTWRLGLVSPARVVAAAATAGAALVIAGLSMLSRPVAAEPDAVIGLAFADSAGRVTFESVELLESSWVPQDTLRSSPWPGPDIRLVSANGFNIAYSPVASYLVTAQAVSDSGVIDLFEHRIGQPSRRLFPALRDDVAPAISPDGRMVAFSTARWDSLYRYDIAVARLGDSVARRLTAGPSSDLSVRWSPDGERLAFARTHWGESPNEVCVVVPAGGRVSCIALPDPFDEPSIHGWLDRDRLLVETISDAYRRPYIVQWSSREFLPFQSTPLEGGLLSPDGKWIFCTCGSDPAGSRHMAVVPAAAPRLVRPLSVPVGQRVFLGAFWMSARSAPSAHSIRLERIAAVHAGVPSQLRATIRDQQGRVVDANGGLRWYRASGAHADLDSLSGIITARADSPYVRVFARAGSAVSDTLSIPVDTAGGRLVLEEMNRPEFSGDSVRWVLRPRLAWPAE